MQYRPTTLPVDMRLVRVRALFMGSAATLAERVHAPAGSLAFAFAPLGGGRPATVSPQAQNESCGPLFRRSLALAPCPTQKRCSSGAPLLRPPPCGGLRAPRPRPPVSGIRSACQRSLRFAPVAGARSGASPLLPRVRPAARAAFSRRPCRSAPAAPLLRLAALAAPKFTFGIVRHPTNCIYTVLIFNLKNYIC